MYKDSRHDLPQNPQGNQNHIINNPGNKALNWACILFACATPVFAANVTVINASFEDPTGLKLCNTVPPLYPAGCRFSSGPPTGWTPVNSIDGYAGTFQPSTVPNAAFVKLGDLLSNAFINGNGTGNGGGNTAGAYLTQTVAANTFAGTTYTLMVDLGWRSDNVAFVSEADLIINGTTVIKAQGTPPAQGYFSTFTATYVAATAGQSIAIKLLNTGASQANFDNVILNAIPEPGTIALSALGLGMLAFRLRRRRSN